MKYLSIKQALADVAEFVTYIQSKYSFPYKLIVFGGSYPASLAIWARMQYPNLIHCAMVSSPTLNVQVENHGMYYWWCLVITNNKRLHFNFTVKKNFKK